MTHYIVVRRDLNLGTALAMVTHAAGESFYNFCNNRPRSSVKEHFCKEEAGGLSPSGGSNFDISQTVAVVLGARNESKLQRLEKQLLLKSIPFVAIRETEGDFAGQLMAIGLEPGDNLSKVVNEFQLITSLDSQVQSSLSG